MTESVCQAAATTTSRYITLQILSGNDGNGTDNDDIDADNNQPIDEDLQLTETDEDDEQLMLDLVSN